MTLLLQIEKKIYYTKLFISLQKSLFVTLRSKAQGKFHTKTFISEGIT